MNIIFWNLAKNSIEQLVAECVREHSADVLCLAELRDEHLMAMTDALGSEFRLLNPGPLGDKVRVFLRQEVMQRSRVFVESRFLVCTIEYRDESYNIAVAHLQDQRNDPKGSARSDTLQDLVSKVRDLEAEQGCGNSIVIGDFNTDPFAEEMIKPTTLFSTMFKDVIVQRGVRSRRGKTCQMMYNPVISCLSESDGCYGSYYYDKDYSPLYWHFYDQIIVSGPLVDRVRQYEYLKRIGEKDLLRSGRPDKRVSDHLPLFAEIASLDYE